MQDEYTYIAYYIKWLQNCTTRMWTKSTIKIFHELTK